MPAIGLNVANEAYSAVPAVVASPANKENPASNIAFEASFAKPAVYIFLADKAILANSLELLNFA